MAHEIETIKGDKIEVLTIADLDAMFSNLKTMLLKWIAWVGLTLVVSGAVTFTRLENRVTITEHRNATDSIMLLALDVSGSQPLRSLARDLEETRRQMMSLQESLSKLAAVVTELRIQLARK